MKTLTLRILVSLALLVSLAAPSYSKELYVLCYHAFLDKKDSYTLTREQFRDNLSTLKNSGFTFVAFDDVINDRITGSKNILITIDDGNHSVYGAYYSVMKPMGIRPVLSIYPAIIGRRHYAMNWDQVRRLADEGCYIASHGYHHMFLSKKYFAKNPVSFNQEIYLSKKVLEEKLNRKIETMIYPFGVNCDLAVNELKKAGYRYGMTLKARATVLPVRDNFKIARYLMTKQRQKEIIATIVKNAGKSRAATANYASNSVTPKEKTKERARKTLL